MRYRHASWLAVCVYMYITLNNECVNIPACVSSLSSSPSYCLSPSYSLWSAGMLLSDTIGVLSYPDLMPTS